ncbi:hypothetical protein LCGC14_0891800 [marine sediment metagenome]|uniref:Glycosyl transferase family 1 domain-containing protein n=1 Tax=marine sediment metagenome TaxID=412755 RepID=A0A0F9S5Y6_9ZZZZ
MRISFSVPLKPLSGKHKFAMRLASAMKKKGIKITDKKPHVNLVFIKGVRLRCKNIFRLDGVWMNNKINFRKKNKKLVKMIKSCDGVIYQNDFCKQASDHFLGKFSSHKIIFNGAPLNLEGGDIYFHRKPYILTFCRWRPHKRLKETVKGFLRSELAEDYDLLVLGENPDYVKKYSAVVYKGKITKELPSIIRGCEYVVHLAYIDWCPNSVVESLVCGKNILHANTGGTKDIVQNNGVKIADLEWDFTPIELYKPPRLDKDELSKGFHHMFKLPKPQADYLNIDRVADQYISYCQEISN